MDWLRELVQDVEAAAPEARLERCLAWARAHPEAERFVRRSVWRLVRDGALGVVQAALCEPPGTPLRDAGESLVSVASTAPWLRPIGALSPWCPACALALELAETEPGAQPGTAVTLPDGRVATDGDTLRLWDLARGSCVLPWGARERCALEPSATDARILVRTSTALRVLDPAGGSSLAPWPITALSRARSPVRVLRCMTLLADGAHAALGDRALTVWNLQTDTCVHTWAPRAKPLTVLLAHPNGKTLFAGGRDRDVRVYDLTDHTVSRVLPGGRAGGVTALALSPDGARLLALHEGSTLRLWNLTTDALTWEQRLDGAAITGLALSAEGTHAFVLWYDGQLARVELATGRLDRSTHLPGVYSARLTALAGGRAVVVRAYEKLYTLETDRFEDDAKGLSPRPHGVVAQMDRTGRWVFELQASGVKVWSSGHRTPLHHVTAHRRRVELAAVRLLRLHPTEPIAATLGWDRKLYVWNFLTNAGLAALRVSDAFSRACSMEWAGDGRALWLVDANGALLAWEPARPTELAPRADARAGRALYAPAWGSSELVLATGDDEVEVRDGGSGALVRAFHLEAPSEEGVCLAGFDVLERTRTNALRRWSALDGRVAWSRGGNAVWRGLDSCRGGLRGACGVMNDGRFELLDLRTGAVARTLAWGASVPDVLAVAPSGQVLLTASADGTAQLWNLATGASLARWHEGVALTSCAFAGERTIVLGCASGQLRWLELTEPSRGGA